MHHNNSWQRFIDLCQTATHHDKLSDLFCYIFTLEEQQQLATRVMLTKALLNGEHSQRDIAAELKISISKITRGSNALKIIDDDLKLFLQQQL